MSESHKEMRDLDVAADSAEHHDLLALLSLVQHHKIEWVQPTSQYWKTLSSKSVSEWITQFEDSHQADYTLKPLVDSGPYGNFDKTITEINILCQPSIEDCKRIVSLKGIVLDLCPVQKDHSVTSNGTTSTEIVPPVFLFEKPTHGNLRTFLTSTGQNLSFESKIDLCTDILDALVTLHDARTYLYPHIFLPQISNLTTRYHPW